jgi:hypothetical protein
MDFGELTVQAMLCDFAEVSGNKLFVSGAGINLIGTSTSEPPHPVSFALAALVRIPWTATNHEHTLRVELVADTSDKSPERVQITAGDPPSGKEEDRGTILAIFNMGRSAAMQPGEESLLPVAFPMFGLPLPTVGSYYFNLSIDGTDIQRVSFRVTSFVHTPGMPVSGAR